MEKIKGGYVLRPRSTKHSDIAHSSPTIRELFEWLVREANHATNQKCKRGECIRTYRQMREGLHWLKGWEKRMYSKWAIERALKTLREARRIATRKTTRGMVITICNYDYYQNPKNYEGQTIRKAQKATGRPHQGHTINKNANKNERIEEERNKFIKKLSEVFHPDKKQAYTFANIIQHLNDLCIRGRDRLFSEACVWIDESKDKNKPVGFFIWTVKEKTGWKPPAKRGTLGREFEKLEAKFKTLAQEAPV